MKHLILLLAIISTPILAQVTAPSGYTTNYGYRLYNQGANPSSDSLNQNWTDIDGDVKAAYDSATSATIVKTYKNNTITGNTTFNGYVGINGRLILPDQASQLYATELWTTSASGGYLVYAADTLATQNWVEANYAPTTPNGYRIIYADAVTNGTVNTTATSAEYSVNVTTSTSEVTYYPIIIPYFKQSDEDSLIMRYDSYYNLDLGTAVIQQARIRFRIDGTTFYGSTETTADGGAGYTANVLKASISGLADGWHYIQVALGIDLDTGSAGASTHYLRRPFIYVRY